MAHTFPRIAAHADESCQDSLSGYFYVQFITENEPGFVPFGAAKDLNQARADAASFNEAAGLTADDVAAIRLSSMTARSI